MQRRLNTRFLVILTLVVGGVAVGGVIGGKLLFQATPEKHIQKAELFVREGRLKEAADEYKRAISKNPRNAEVYVKLGDTLRALTRTDAFMVGKDQDAWNAALEVDPSYLPAMQRLLDSYIEETQLWVTPATFGRVRDICTRLLAVDPTDAKARAHLHMAWLQSWLAGVETMPAQIDESMRELQSIHQKDPSNVDVPFLVARAQIRRARDLSQQMREAEAGALVADAVKVMEGAVTASPEACQAHLRQGQILMEISGLYPRDPAQRKQYREKATAAVLRASELAKPEDPAYVEVNMAVGQIYQQDQKFDQARGVFEELLKQRPEDGSVRLALAQLLATDPSKRPEAVALLEQTISDEAGLIGSRVRLRNELQLRSLLALAGLRIDALMIAKAEEEKSELEEKVDEHLKEIFNRQGESPEYLKLKGRFYQAKNQFVDAIQTYTRAAAILAQSNRSRDDDMMFQLARVYAAAQQTGEARNIFKEIVARHEAFVPARISLAKLLLQEGGYAEAAPHLQWLEAHVPNEPQVTVLLLAAAAAKSDKATTTELLSRLPEETGEQRRAKARAAMQSRLYDHALRLAELVLEETPADDEATAIVVQTLLRQGKDQEARERLDAALAANPEGRNLRLIKAQLEGGQHVAELIEENVEAIEDDYSRELAKARLAEALGKSDDVLAHLKKAEQIKPDGPEVWDMFFQHYARVKEWNKLQPYMDKLIAANQDRAGGLLYRFRLAMARGEGDGAIDIARQLTVKLPEFAQSWLALGQSLQAVRRYDEAIEAFLRVLEKQATNVDAYRGIIECCYGRRRFDDAARHIADGRRRLPNNALLRQFEIEHELTYGQPEKVIGIIEAQANQQLDRPEAWLLLARAYERIVHRKAGKGDADLSKWSQKLQSHLAQAFEKWPGNDEFARRLAEIHIFLKSREEGEKVLIRHQQRSAGRIEPVIMLADFYIRTDQPSHAEMLLRKATAEFRDSVELYRRLANVQVSTGKIDEALQTLDAAPKSDDIVMHKLEIMLQAGRIKQAKEMIQSAIAKRGEDMNLLNAQAYIALQENDVKAALGYAERSLTLRPNNAGGLQQRAYARLREQRPDIDGAIIDLKLAIQQSPANIELRLTTAEAYLARQDRESAIRELESAIGYAPSNRSVWSKLLDMYVSSTPPKLDDARGLIEQIRAAGGGDDVELNMRSAQVAALRRDTQTAISDMRRAIDLSGGHEAIVRRYCYLLLDLRQYQQLLSESEEFMRQAPGAWWLRHVRALAEVRQGANENAIAEWEKSLGLADAAKDESAAFVIMDSIAREMGVSQVMARVLERARQEPRWIIFAAQLYQRAGDMKNAVAMVEQAAGQLERLSDDEQLRALQVAGAVYLGASPAMVEKAIDVYQRVLAKAPEDLATLNNLACIYADGLNPPNPARALEYSKRAYDVMKKRGVLEPLVMDTHGWALVQAGQVQEGIVLLQEVVQRDPFLDVRYHLAEAYLRGNYVEAAIRQLEEVKAMLADADKNNRRVDPDLRSRINRAIASVATRADAPAEGAGGH